MDKLLKVIVSLTAVDKMSSVISKVVGQSIGDLDKLKKASGEAFGKGSKLLGAGVAVSASLAPAVSAFAELEDSSTRLKTLLMAADGSVGKDFQKVNDLAISLGNRLPGTTADFQNLFSVMLKNGMDAKNILSGVGESAAFLAVNLKMPTDQVGEFAARMKLATGVADNQMLSFMDTLNRIDQVGIKADEMSYAFQRSTASLKLLGLQGLESTMQMSNIFAQLIRETGSGERVGTGFKNILSAMLDPKKYTAFQEAAKDAGVQLQMFDKGKFLGIENMVKQFNKLKGLSIGNQSLIANALTGGGNDSELLLLLASKGVNGYQSMNAELAKHATLAKQVSVQLGTLRQIWEATTGTVTNMMAALGAGLGPELKIISNVIGKAAGAMQLILTANPSLAKFITLTIAGVGALLSVVGIINLVKGAFIALRIVMMANPFIAVATLAIAAGALIYSNWGKITKFFKGLWDGIKRITGAFWGGFKTFLLNYTPHGLIYKHWAGITKFFLNLWLNVKEVFVGFFNWFAGLHMQFFNAGANIAKSIWNGIKSMAHKPIEAIRDMTKKMRNYLPFSPAKEGAFKDLHKVKIVETIAQAIKPSPVIRAMRNMTTMAAASAGLVAGVPQPGFAGGLSGGNTIFIQFSPTITGGDPQSIMSQLRQYAPELARLVNSEIEKQNRRKYS